jgi:cyclopropane-fatty-acyl-phospholipid synthase
MSRRLLFAILGRLRHGRIEVEEGGERRGFGPAGAELRATVRVHHPGAWRALLRGSTGLAESYADGLWDCDDLVALVRIAAREMRRYDRARRALVPLQRAGRLVPRNTRRRSGRHIAAHYDLGDDLFELFLDESMTYSCADFQRPGMTLAEAQEAKLDRACRALELRPDDHLLEIGTGWGSLALFAAERYGCRVTTATISRAQHAAARARVREAGLESQVTVLLSDYRDLRGQFDKLVSIEMVEAVGWQYFELFFRRCSELLTPEGLMLLQAIVIEDGAYEAEKASRSFINKYIFPGGCLPSPAVIAKLTEAAGLRRLDRHDLTPDYAETLLRWRDAFLARSEDAAALGYDRRFRRLWELYLCYTEAGFRERRIGVVQQLLAAPGRADPHPGSRLKMRSLKRSSTSAGPREASFASAVLPPGPTT